MATETARRPKHQARQADPAVEELVDWLARACERRSAAEQKKRTQSAEQTPKERAA